ncbi:MAG: hypothetical protein KGI06_03870 [Candidatus Micrarchaeota archaeon]|nr:hypothetical protein [Candidatus Micrarchaeota archaeon]
MAKEIPKKQGNKKLIFGLAVLIIAIIALAGFILFNQKPANKLPLTFIPSCNSNNNCTESGCPATSYYNSSLGYCYWNASIYFSGSGVRPNCPPGAVYQNNSNCKAEGSQLAGALGVNNSNCAAGYVYDKQNGLCEPLPDSCTAGYSLFSQNGKEECVLSNACGNSGQYSLTFNTSINQFLCVRQS